MVGDGGGGGGATRWDVVVAWVRVGGLPTIHYIQNFRLDRRNMTAEFYAAGSNAIAVE